MNTRPRGRHVSRASRFRLAYAYRPRGGWFLRRRATVARFTRPAVTS